MKFGDLFDVNLNPIWERIESVPEFAVLKETKQNQKWHQEGCVWNHTKLVVEAMHKRVNSDSFMKLSGLFFMASALCHDLGKATTTYFSSEDNDYHCESHGEAGERIVRRLFFDEDIRLRERVCALVRRHMEMHQIVRAEGYDTTLKKLIKLSYSNVTVFDAIQMYICDSIGAINKETDEYVFELAKKIEDIARKELVLMRPYLFETWEGKHGYFTQYTPSENEFTMYVMIGIPGSGKDYWVDTNFKGKGIKKISRDIIRTKIGMGEAKCVGDRGQEKKVTEIAHKEILDCCHKRKSFVICDTNLHKFFRNELTKLVFQYRPKIEYIFVDTPIEICKERRNGEIPEEVIDRMFDKMDYPTTDEYDEFRIVDGV